ncbi:thioredoxin family protein [bacterium]|nr:thioredoxin family protein [bacterium]
MIKKFILIIFTVLLSAPVFASELEKALAAKQRVFLYLTSDRCGYCVRFNPIYNKIRQKYGNTYKFIKLDISTQEGYITGKRFDVNYVPYVLVINGENMEGQQIPTKCLLNYSCTERAINNFFNN